ncbi:pentatricopeptide repeat-containing protein At2g01860 [Humulus lupulus]|uniref:pentatricopeptide repeat-containing protein At2g01860 n=1 Tax=Humulus lupulus TaxID=3486 RepID=UPI002B40DCD4|nr:pentatricopeptide repeat-containing protein At2g01860 [Humulus lupulus]
MDCRLLTAGFHSTPYGNFVRNSRVILMGYSKTRRKLTKNLRYPMRSRLPPNLGTNLFLKNKKTRKETYHPDMTNEEGEEKDGDEDDGNEIVWGPDEIEAITSLFQGRIPQKPGKLGRERTLPLPLPHKLRPLGLPTPKKRVKMATTPGTTFSRSPLSKHVYKSPGVLIGLAREIKNLPAEKDVSLVLNKCVKFLRKGSLSMTVRELGHLNLPERALQTFCWVQKQPHLFPDDRILVSTIEVLARNHALKVPFDLKRFVGSASQSVIEAMVRGFTKGGSLHLAWKFLSLAKDNDRMLNSSVYAKVINELGKNPDKYALVETLLNELGDRQDLTLSQQDYTAIMKVCIRLGKFETIESIYEWFKLSGHDPSIVMYTTLIHSRCLEKKYREALAVVWEMEESNCLFDLPAYRVVIRLFVALNDLSRASRYFSKLKESGFSPTYDIYKDLINLYMVSGRLAMCKDVCKEAEVAGYKLDKQVNSRLLQLGRAKPVKSFLNSDLMNK